MKCAELSIFSDSYLETDHTDIESHMYTIVYIYIQYYIYILYIVIYIYIYIYIVILLLALSLTSWCLGLVGLVEGLGAGALESDPALALARRAHARSRRAALGEDPQGQRPFHC